METPEHPSASKELPSEDRSQPELSPDMEIVSTVAEAVTFLKALATQLADSGTADVPEKASVSPGDDVTGQASLETQDLSMENSVAPRSSPGSLSPGKDPSDSQKNVTVKGKPFDAADIVIARDTYFKQLSLEKAYRVYQLYPPQEQQRTICQKLQVTALHWSVFMDKLTQEKFLTHEHWKQSIDVYDFSMKYASFQLTPEEKLFIVMHDKQYEYVAP